MRAAESHEPTPPRADAGTVRPAGGGGRAGRRPFGVFVSYRRDDSAGHTGRLFDKLARRFGPRRVFMDLNAIQPGMDFRNAIDRALESSSVVLAIIGRNWLEASDADGARRLDSPTDLVRLEIASALRQGMDVIPVLVQRASMPPAERLPEDIQALTWRHAIEIDDARWDQDVERLIGAIERTRIVDSSRRSPLPTARVAVALGLVAAVAVGAIVLALQRSQPGPIVAGSPSPSVTGSASTGSEAPTSPSPTGPPTFETILFADELDGPVQGLPASRTESCQVEVAGGLSITARRSNYVCDVSTAAADPAIVSLQDVRVEADIAFSMFSKTTSEYGPGDAALTCRTLGSTARGDYYIASLSPSGYWSIDRFVRGTQNRLDFGIEPDLVTPISRTRRLEFTCLGHPGETATLSLAIDGRPIATVLDPNGSGPGSVALAVTPYEAAAIAATFRNLEIRAP